MSKSQKPKQCCVPGCLDVVSKRHRFPYHAAPHLFQEWIQVINNPKLKDLSEEDVYKRYVVCDRHFTDYDKVVGTKRGIRATAVPRLYILPGETMATLPSVSTEREIVEDNPPLPSTSTQIDTDNLVAVNVEDDTVAKDTLPKPEQAATVFSEDVHSMPSTSQHIQADSAVMKIGNNTRRRKNTTLTCINVSRQNQLTPRAKRLYKMVSASARRASVLQRKFVSLKARVDLAKKFSDSNQFTELLKFVNQSTYELILCQIRNQKLTPKARRFTLQEKILCLALFKSSGRGYRLLSKIFTLPSKKTLTAILNKIPSAAGVNPKMFEILQSQVAKMTEKDKCCTLIFDEMSLSCNLTYDQSQDCIVGLEDDGLHKQPKLANYVNVFMLKGCFKHWKQPVAYSFSSGPAKSANLKVQIRQIIAKSLDIGLKVVSVICDQGSANQAAINSLLKDTAEECARQGVAIPVGFLVDSQEIIPLYDPPHLFKGIRNNLLKKNLHFRMNDKDCVAKWEHIEQFYFLDICEQEYRMCPKLTDAHVIKGKINKMKVSACMQVFSHQVGALMLRLSQWDMSNTPVKLDKEAADTGKLILFLDKLFDSLNGDSPKAASSKPLKGGVTQESPHEEFWRYSLETLATMRFFSAEQNRFVHNPSLANLVKTLNNFIYLKSVLLKGHNFKYFLPRIFNQDSLENFFGCIKSYGARNVSPDVSHFISSFKSLIVTNLMSHRSPGANCEEETSSNLLNTFYGLIAGDVDVDLGVRPLENMPESLLNIPSSVSVQQTVKISSSVSTYMAGYFVKKILSKYQSCGQCKQNFLSFCDRTETELIEAREYSNSQLVRPGSFTVFFVNRMSRHLFYLLPRLCHFDSIKASLIQIMKDLVDVSPLRCTVHPEVAEKFFNFIVRCSLFFWTKQVNKIAKGKDSKFIKFFKLNPPQVDPIKLQAMRMQEKLKKYKRAAQF